MSEISHIDCGYLPLIQAKQERIWQSPMSRVDVTPYADVLKAILANQQVNFGDIQGEKDRTISLEWLQKCTVTTSECTDDCLFTGDDVTPICKSYELECLRESSFTIDVLSYRTRTVDVNEVIAENMLRHKKALIEYAAQYVLAALHANAGVNLFTGGIGNVVADMTYIPSIYWDKYIFGYLTRASVLNKFTNAYILDGGNLWDLIWKTQKQASDGSSEGGSAMLGEWQGKIYEDLFNFPTAGLGSSTFLLHKTAVALVTKAYYNAYGVGNPFQVAGYQLRWSESDFTIPSIKYDITRNERCESDKIYYDYKIKLTGGFFVNPEPCDETNNGILELACGNAPS